MYSLKKNKGIIIIIINSINTKQTGKETAKPQRSNNIKALYFDGLISSFLITICNNHNLRSRPSLVVTKFPSITYLSICCGNNCRKQPYFTSWSADANEVQWPFRQWTNRGKRRERPSSCDDKFPKQTWCRNDLLLIELSGGPPTSSFGIYFLIKGHCLCPITTVLWWISR